MPVAKDFLGNPLQLLLPHVAHLLAVDGTVRTSADFNAATVAVELCAAEDCYFKFGDSTVEAAATDFFLKGDVPVIYPIGSYKRIAAIKHTIAGELHVTELRG